MATAGRAGEWPPNMTGKLAEESVLNLVHV
jgi:hypothetical protein